MWKIIGWHAVTTWSVFKRKIQFSGKQCIDPLKAVLSLIYRRLLVVILCCKSLTIKVDVRLCLGNKNVDTPIEGDLASTRLEFSMALLGTRL